MKKISLFFLLSSNMVLGQDLHLSMPEYLCMASNPALAGANSSLQVTVNYRNQWGTVASPFTTAAASIDGRINENRKRGYLVAGGFFVADKSGDLRITTNTANLNFGYYIRLGKYRKLGVALQGVFGQRGVSKEGATYPSQYDGMAFNASLPGENFNNPAFAFMSVGAGLNYSFERKDGYMRQRNKVKYNLGAAVFNANVPYYSYFINGEDRLAIRYNFFLDSYFEIKNTEGTIMPGVYAQMQSGSFDILAGAKYRYVLSYGSQKTEYFKPIALYAGLYYRYNDAMVARFQFEYREFMTGFSYDMNVSRYKVATGMFGGIELFLRYNIVGGFQNRKKLQ